MDHTISLILLGYVLVCLAVSLLLTLKLNPANAGTGVSRKGFEKQSWQAGILSGLAYAAYVSNLRPLWGVALLALIGFSARTMRQLPLGRWTGLILGTAVVGQFIFGVTLIEANSIPWLFEKFLPALVGMAA